MSLAVRAEALVAVPLTLRAVDGVPVAISVAAGAAVGGPIGWANALASVAIVGVGVVLLRRKRTVQA